MTGPFILHGKEYTPEGLKDHCRVICNDPGQEEWLREACGFILDFLEEPRRELVQESTGTTGQPKRFSLDRKAMVASARKTLAFFGLEPGDPVLLCLPVTYIAGKMMVVRALTGRLDLHLKSPSSRPFRGEEKQYSLVPLVPLQLHESLSAGDRLSLAGRILVGGAEAGSALRDRLERITEPAVFESFGMSETYSHFAVRRINGPRPEPVFRILEGVHIRTDNRGCLEVRVEGITREYIRTTDMVEVSGDGAAFRWLGRLDNLINTGGIKVHPELLEQRIGSLLGIQCLVVPLPDEKLGQRIVLLAEADAKADTVSWKSVLKDRLEAHEIPREILPVKALPRNRSFKPDRKAALEMLKKRPY